MMSLQKRIQRLHFSLPVIGVMTPQQSKTGTSNSSYFEIGI
jgi:hypothetical protein